MQTTIVYRPCISRLSNWSPKRGSITNGRLVQTAKLNKTQTADDLIPEL